MALSLRAALFTHALILASADTPRYPSHHAHACLGANASFPFCDTTLAIEDRVADLISRLSLAEKVSMTYDRGVEVDSIGLPDYNFNQEGLHGLGAQCFSLTPGSVIRCPTIFAAPPALASSWNTSLLLAIGDTISTEMRAFNNFGGAFMSASLNARAPLHAPPHREPRLPAAARRFERVAPERQYRSRRAVGAAGASPRAVGGVW